MASSRLLGLSRPLLQCSSRSCSDPSYVHGASQKKLQHSTLGEQLRKSVKEHPGREFLIFNAQQIRKTYKEFYEDVRRFAAGLFAMGLKKGDRVGVWGGNYYEWTVCQYATAISGMIQVNINPAYKSSELHYALKKVGCRALVTPYVFKKNNYMSLLAEICPQLASSQPGQGSLSSRDLPDLEHIIVFTNQEPVRGAWDFQEICNGADNLNFKRLDEAEAAVLPDEPVNIQYTSGTTGLPKAATLSHMGLLNIAAFQSQRMGFDRKHTTICVPNPLYHCFGCVMGVVVASVYANTCVFPAINFNIKKTLESIEKYKCNYIYGTPTMYIDLLNHPDLKKHDLSSMEGACMASSMCPPALCEVLQKALNLKEFFIVYGSTELSPLATCAVRDEPIEQRIKNVGYVLPHTELLIVDEKGKAVPRGEKGELLVRGYMTMLGYWEDEDKTKKTIDRAGWYHTGDVASMDEKGAVSIIGRNKDMIIKGGENIYPTEIEQFLFKLPYVADAQVVGVPDERLGETVCVWIRLRDGFGEVTAEKIKQDCKDKIAVFKIPTYVMIKKMEDFPLTATGKIQKAKIRELSKKELGLEKAQSPYNA